MNSEVHLTKLFQLSLVARFRTSSDLQPVTLVSEQYPSYRSHPCSLAWNLTNEVKKEEKLPHLIVSFLAECSPPLSRRSAVLILKAKTLGEGQQTLKGVAHRSRWPSWSLSLEPVLLPKQVSPTNTHSLRFKWDMKNSFQTFHKAPLLCLSIWILFSQRSHGVCVCGGE